ncbi:MAG: stress response translation initiation inhibitor YciH [Desulfuromonadaceae bacterium]|nr:stress response translation initiation inhibitor YciH [Desulfuromonadaceae bacterium]
MKDGHSRLVYSDEGNGDCSRCGRPLRKCRCSQQRAALPTDGVVRIQRQTKGRKGSGATVITGVPLTGDELKNFAKGLKQTCGSGGTVKNGQIEIQGDHVERLMPLLTAQGWVVKRAGG